MKKVMQTVTGLGGNCEGATIATLLGLELSEIPDFWEGCDIETPALPENGIIYQRNVNNFLEKYGYKMLSLGVPRDPSERDQQWVTDISKHLGIKHIVAGISPRGYMHSVIYEMGELWHDPHPEGGGVIPCQLCLLLPIFKEKKHNVFIDQMASSFREGFEKAREKDIYNDNKYCWMHAHEAWENSDIFDDLRHVGL